MTGAADSDAATYVSRWDAAMMPNYGTPPLLLTRGQGATVWDSDGKAYLDLLGGIAVSSLGHAHPALVAAVTRQVGTLVHTSNLYAHEPGLALAERLLALLGHDGRVFFCQDGTEANEAALKLARLHGRALDPAGGRMRVVAADGSFHGRTLGSLSLTGNPSKREPFEPLPGPVTFVPYGDAAALDAAVDETVAAVFLEPALGEGGVVVPPPGYLAAARAACDRVGALLVVDEVQSGIGRTGALVRVARRRGRPRRPHARQGAGRRHADRRVHRSRRRRQALHARLARLDVRRQPGLVRRGARSHRHHPG